MKEAYRKADVGLFRDFERMMILRTLKSTGKRGKTAELLNISISTLYRRLKDYERRGYLNASIE